MKFGVFFLNEKPPGASDRKIYSEAIEQCRAADELGFDALWLGEHHFAPYGTMADTLLFGAAVAEVTEQIKIGTACIVPAFGHPIRIAEQIAMLDVMSDGRVYVGLGRGYQQREFNGFNIPQSESTVRFREATQIIEGLLSNERFSYDGQFWQVNDVSVYPRPLQQPVPIFIAASRTPESFAWIVEKGFGALIGNPYTVDPSVKTQGEAASVLRAAQRDAGVPESLENAWGLHQNVLLHEDSKQAAKIFKQNWDVSNEYLVKYAKVVEDDSELPEDYKYYAGFWNWLQAMEYDEMLKMTGVLIGSPDEITEKLIHLYEHRGIQNHILWMNRGGAVDQKDILHSMELFATEVLPNVRHIGEPVATESVAG